MSGHGDGRGADDRRTMFERRGERIVVISADMRAAPLDVEGYLHRNVAGAKRKGTDSRKAGTLFASSTMIRQVIRASRYRLLRGQHKQLDHVSAARILERRSAWIRGDREGIRGTRRQTLGGEPEVEVSGAGMAIMHIELVVDLLKAGILKAHRARIYPAGCAQFGM